MSELKPCPRGATPTALAIQIGDSCKYAWVVGADCCTEWAIEFRTGYHDIDSPECMKRAVDAWNEAPRAGERQ